MMDNEIFQIMRPIIMTVTGVPECILADPNAEAPNGAYASVRPRQSVSERGQANIYTSDQPNDMVRTEIRSQIVCRCEINFWRGEALRYAELLKECHKRPDVAWTMFKHKIGWAGTEAVNNLTALQSNNYEQRAQLVIKLYYETSQTVDFNNILSASLSVQNEKAKVLRTVDISGVKPVAFLLDGTHQLDGSQYLNGIIK